MSEQDSLEELQRRVLEKRVAEKRALEGEASDGEVATPEEQAAQRLEDLKTPEVSPFDAALTGLAHGVTASYSDELAARGRSMLFGEKPYEDYLAEEREHIAQAKAQHPKTFTGADIIGTVVSPVTKVLGPARYAGTMANVGHAALMGGVIASGASTANPFESEEGLKEFAADTGMGMLFGGATEGAFGTVGKVAGALSPASLKQFANERILKGATGQNLGLLTKIFKKGKDAQIARHLEEGVKLDNKTIIPGVITFGSKASEIVPHAEMARKATWNRMKDIYTAVDEATGGKSINGFEVARNILKEAKKIPKSTQENINLRNMLAKEARLAKKLGTKTITEIMETPAMSGLSPELIGGTQKTIKRFEELPMSLADAQRYKNQIKYKEFDDLTTALGKDGKNIIKRAYTKAMADSVERFASKEVANHFKELKNAYQSFATIAPAVHKNRAREVSNRFFSPSDYGMATVGTIGAILAGQDETLAEGTATGIAVGLANKIMRERGSTAAGVAASSLAALIAKHPKILDSFRKFLTKVPGSAATPAASQYMFEKDPWEMAPLYTEEQ